VVKNFCF